jgi:hypothetical protein
LGRRGGVPGRLHPQGHQRRRAVVDGARLGRSSLDDIGRHERPGPNGQSVRLHVGDIDTGDIDSGQLERAPDVDRHPSLDDAGARHDERDATPDDRATHALPQSDDATSDALEEPDGHSAAR